MPTDMTIDSTAPGLSEIERVVDIFVAPSKTFADILRSATWWLPFILVVLFGIASAFVVQREVGFDRAYMNSLHSSPTQEDRINNLDPVQKARAIDIGTKITAGLSYGGPVLIVIFFAIYSLVLWAAFNFGLGAQTTFWQVFAVSFYSALPYLIINILIIATVYFGGNAEAFNYKNPVGTNPAYYMPDAAGWLKGLLGAFDVIKLWSVALQVLGMAIIAKKTIAQSAVIVGLCWLFGVLLAIVGGVVGG